MISQDIATQLSLPVFDVRFGVFRCTTNGVLMPETAMHKDSYLLFAKNDVGNTW